SSARGLRRLPSRLLRQAGDRRVEQAKGSHTTRRVRPLRRDYFCSTGMSWSTIDVMAAFSVSPRASHSENSPLTAFEMLSCSDRLTVFCVGAHGKSGSMLADDSAKTSKIFWSP